MSEWVRSALLPLAAYAVGCLNGAYYLVRFRTRQDLRALGSGNAGARNAGRVLGRSGFIAAFIVDAAKGALVVLGARALGASDAVVAWSICAVVAGHVWPVQLRFRGGKGAATAIGFLLVYDVFLLASIVGAGLLLLAATRRLMVAGFGALVLAPMAASIYGHSLIAAAGLAGAVLIVLLAHRVDVSESIDTVDAKLHEVPGTYAPR
jgi:glycerol-3-phosphate acyltransferase PlsY